MEHLVFFDVESRTGNFQSLGCVGFSGGASHVVWNVLASSRSLFVSLETNISSVGLLVRLSESFHDVFI